MFFKTFKCTAVPVQVRNEEKDSNVGRVLTVQDHRRVCIGLDVEDDRRTRQPMILREQQRSTGTTCAEVAGRTLLRLRKPCVGSAVWTPRYIGISTVSQSLCSPSPYFVLGIQLGFPVTTLPRSEFPRSGTQMCEMRSSNGNFGFPESSLRQVERHHWASESPFSVK